MNTIGRRAGLALAALVTGACFAGAALPAGAATAAEPDPRAVLQAPTRAPLQLSTTKLKVIDLKDQIAQRIATDLGDAQFATTVKTAVSNAATQQDEDRRGVELGGLVASRQGLATSVRAAEADILEAKGLPKNVGSVLRMRLATPEMATLLQQGKPLLIAAAPSDDGDQKNIVAYDASGARHLYKIDGPPPKVPLMLVEVDGRRAIEAGLKVIREMAGSASGPGPSPSSRPTPAGHDVTRLKSVYMRDDEEPWYKGDAEVFAVAAGMGKDGQAVVETTQMPYVNDERKYYHPNQTVIDWSKYKFSAVDMLLFEEDDGTNYRALGKTIADAVLTVSGGGAYVPVVNAILDALPDDFWTDDIDYMDSFYSIPKRSAGSTASFTGANGNFDITFEWAFVPEV